MPTSALHALPVVPVGARSALAPPLVPCMDALADWRLGMRQALDDLEALLRDADLLTPESAKLCGVLRQRLAGERLVIAFVAEFSRGKSELINAIFFADAGRRILPATPGRTTMCPVELSWDESQPPALDLLPIDTRLRPDSLSDWRRQPELWHQVPLDPNDSAALAAALQQVTHTRQVSRDEAQALGLWSDEHPEDNPPLGADGLVQVPAWRHAVINMPHPLLRHGLVVVDTPGLNAIGTEPELTLGLLPTAHAALFVLSADAGVTKTDLAVWNQHLSDPSLARFVVLNKVDMMIDPLATEVERERAIERQCSETAATLGVSRDRVFPISARQALAARLQGDMTGLVSSRLPALEAALRDQLLPQRQRLLATAVSSQMQSLQGQVSRRLRDLRRAHAEQMLELRSLRGKSAGRIGQILGRVTADTEEFSRCTARLTALRAVHQRLLRAALAHLDGSHVRDAATRLQATLSSGWFNLGARSAFAQVCGVLGAQVDRCVADAAEAERMLAGSFRQLNAEFGFSLEVLPAPDLAAAQDELQRIERGYARYFGVSGIVRMNSAAFSEQFLRMLVSKLRSVFELAAAEVDHWGEAVLAQIDVQFKERRRAFRHRRETLERIQTATGELERRLGEVERLDERLLSWVDQAFQQSTALRQRALRGPQDEPAQADDEPTTRAIQLGAS